MDKPVAWWTGEFNDEADDFMFDKTKQNHMNHVNSRTHEVFPIPLYTHPVKQLSNDRIREIGDELKLQNGGVLNWIDFARAIIKASRGEE